MSLGHGKEHRWSAFRQPSSRAWLPLISHRYNIFLTSSTSFVDEVLLAKYLLWLFYCWSIISAFEANITSFIEALARLRICLFRSLLFRNLAKLVILVQFQHYCCSQWSPCSHIYCRQIACFHFVCVSHKGCLIGSNFPNFRSKNLKASLSSATLINPCSVLW